MSVVRIFSNKTSQLPIFDSPRFAGGHRQRFNCPNLDKEQPINHHASDDLVCARLLIEFVIQEELEYGCNSRRRRWWCRWGSYHRRHCSMVHNPPAACSLRTLCCLSRGPRRYGRDNGALPTYDRYAETLRESFPLSRAGIWEHN